MEPIDVLLQFRGDVLADTSGAVSCWGAMDLNELLQLFRRHGARLLDPRVRDHVEHHMKEFKELYENPDDWNAVGLTGREVWFICDSFEQEHQTRVRIKARGLRIVAGGEYIASLSTYTHIFPQAFMPVRLYQIAGDDELVNAMITNTQLQNQDNDSSLREHLRTRRSGAEMRKTAPIASISSSDVGTPPNDSLDHQTK